jgi:hypothetical protein
MSYHGLRNWPPVWTWCYGLENKRPRGEIGLLREVVPSKILPVDRCFLYMDYEGSTYIGCLLIDNYAFCGQVAQLLQGYCNRPIADIGSIDLAHTL